MIVEDLASLATPIGDVDLLEDNPRRGDVDAVARSLDRFGQRKPIVARRSDRQVIAGNHTLRAARQLGWHQIAVVWVDDDLAMSRAYAVADNRTGDLGGYDNDLLVDLLTEISSDADLFASTGYNEDDLAVLIRESEISVGDLWADAMDAVPSGDKSPFQQMTFTLHDDQVEQVRAAIECAHALGRYDSPNENRNGNALARICESFIASHNVQ